MTVILSLSEEIATYLQGQTLSTALNYNGVGTVNTFVTVMPSEPDLAVVITEHGGLFPVMTLTGSSASESAIDHSTFQVRTRSGMKGYVVGNALCQSVYKALQGITETRINSSPHGLFHLVTAMQPPIYMGRDENERNMWTQNYRVYWDNPARQ